jgi:hypothetical protein
MALRAGVQTGVALDPMYGEALSTALAVHLLREYGTSALGPKRHPGGLPREKLVRAVEYISGSTGHRANCFRDCSGSLPESLSLYQALQRVYRPVALPVCRRGQSEKSEGTFNHRQVHHQRSCTSCRFRRSEPSYSSFQETFRLTS